MSQSEYDFGLGDILYAKVSDGRVDHEMQSIDK
jgi:hypothetical protein